MTGSLLEKLWLVAGLAFIAYPIGDIFSLWEIEAPIVLLAAILLLMTGWNVGKRGKSHRG